VTRCERCTREVRGRKRWCKRCAPVARRDFEARRNAAKRVSHLTVTRLCAACGDRFSHRRKGRPRRWCYGCTAQHNDRTLRRLAAVLAAVPATSEIRYRPPVAPALGKRKPLEERRRFVYEIRIECQDGKERWRTSIPLTWSGARGAANQHEAQGRTVRVRELDAVGLVRINGAI